MSRSRGFTIIELLVSIGIFTVASTLMLGALFGATELYRRSESARQGGDEATAVFAMLQADLLSLVPIRIRNGKPAVESGQIFADVGTAGNCRLAFVVENRDRSTIGIMGTNARKWVAWYVVRTDPTDPTRDILRRAVYDWSPGSSIPSMSPTDGQVITTGCLHFGIWADIYDQQAHRKVATGPEVQWEEDNILPYGNPVPPEPQNLNTSDLVGNPQFYPVPDALRISMVLTGGGRYPIRGWTVGGVDSNALAVRTSGIPALPTVVGSKIRINDEWVGHSSFTKGTVIIADNGRGKLRSAATDHPNRSLVLAGQPFSLVVALPR